MHVSTEPIYSFHRLKDADELNLVVKMTFTMATGTKVSCITRTTMSANISQYQENYRRR